MRLLPAFVVLLFIFASARADNVVITAGSMTLSSSVGGASLQMSFAGVNFNVQSGGSGAGQVGCQPCATGLNPALASSSGFIAPNEMTGAGSVTYNGVTYLVSTELPKPTPPAISLSGGFDFIEDPFNIPTTGESILFVDTPFSCSGDLGGRDSSFNTVFSLHFTGSGIATIELHRFGSFQNLYSISNITYTFTSVPEPTSILLLGTGVVLGLARKLGKRRSI